jgi:isopentenyl diphosphate isomerase/L-lactate dehydrogenase-like FMN-dependent dehydrogenase
MARPLASIADVRLRARRSIPRFAFDYVDGAAGDERTARRNEAAFDDWVLRPSYLRDVSRRDQRVTLFGRTLETPVLLSPTGLARLSGRDGDLAGVRAAGRGGTLFALASSSSHSIEEIASAASGPLWLQIFLWTRGEVLEQFVARAERAGYDGLVVTVDVPVVGRRTRDIRNGFSLPPRPRPRTAAGMLRHPRWTRDVLRPTVSFRNLDDSGVASPRRTVAHAEYVNRELTNPAATTADLARLRERWAGTLLVKGVLTGEDAERMVEAGADGVIVSNHGGRQLDGVPAALDALPEIVAAVGDRVEVILDGGVRRGTDVLTALALGARAVSIGRPWVYGLAAGGEAGVSRVLELLHDELDTALALVGRASPAEVDGSLLAAQPASSPAR